MRSKEIRNEMSMGLTCTCKTVDDVVDCLISSMNGEEIEEIKGMREEALVFLHFGLGDMIRNSFGLWSGNKDLLRACGSEDTNPDDASMVIVERIWRRLQTRH